MQAYIARRLLALIPTLFFASVIVFVTVRMIPGDAVSYTHLTLPTILRV